MPRQYPKPDGYSAIYSATQYDGVIKKRRSTVSSSSANVVNQYDAETLTQLAREADENDGVVTAILDALVAYTVGPGLKTEPLVCDKDGNLVTELNQELKQGFDSWMQLPDIAGRLYGSLMQQMHCRALKRDGDVFIVFHEGYEYPHPNPEGFPLSISLLESDFVPHNKTEYLDNIVQGIQLNKFGASVGYWMYKNHPGDWQSNDDLIYVPATKVIHSALIKRLGQVRGITLFAPSFERLDGIRDYDNSEMNSALLASNAGMQLRTSSDAPVAGTLKNTPNILELHPGAVTDDLNAGQWWEAIEFKNTPNSQFGPFTELQMRKLAAATAGASYSMITGHFAGSYSSLRQESNDSVMKLAGGIANFARDQHQIYKKYVQTRFLYGLNEFTDLKSINIKTLYNADHHSPRVKPIDPLKDINAIVAALDAGVISKSGAIRGENGNPEQVRAERAKDNTEDERLGLNVAPQIPNIEAEPVDDEED